MQGGVIVVTMVLLAQREHDYYSGTEPRPGSSVLLLEAQEAPVQVSHDAKEAPLLPLLWERLRKLSHCLLLALQNLIYR